MPKILSSMEFGDYVLQSPLKYALNVYWHWGHTNRYSKYINNLKNLF